MLDIDFLLQTPVFTLQPFDVARVFERDGNHRGNGGQEMQVVFIQVGAGMCRVGINDSQLRTEDGERHAKQRPDL